MQRTIHSSGAKINAVVGPMVMVIGVGAAVAGIVLSIVIGTPGFLAFFIPAALAIGGGLLIIRMSRRAGLRIEDEGFRWCGFFGPEQSLAWHQVQQIFPPPPGSRRVAALAQLRDGSVRQIDAVWQSPTSPVTLLGDGGDREALHALIAGHQDWLSRRR